MNRQTQRLLAIVEIQKMLNSTLNLDRILEIILETAIKKLDADSGTLYLIDHEKKELWSRVLKGETKVEIRLPIGKGISGYVAKTGKKVILKDAYKDPRFNREVDKQTGYHTKTMLCTPMKDRNRKRIGVFQIINKKKGYFNEEDIKFLDLLSVDACIAIDNARLYKEALEMERIGKELEVAASIQKMILPKEIPQPERFEITGFNVPSKQVGGDYYDAIPLPNGNIALVVADVSGKSVSAALLVSILQASLRAYLEDRFVLTKLVGKLNRIILNQSTAEKFITFFIAILDPRARTIRAVNAGHNPPLLVRDGQLTKLKTGGVALGCIEFDQYVSEDHQLQPGDTLVMFTDGVTEATTKSDKLYDDDRLEKFVLANSNLSASDLIEAIYKDVETFVGNAEQSDDITLLILKAK
jgi:sigma-B regulation protein RsbU (phosphoserine phosphatase)